MQQIQIVHLAVVCISAVRFKSRFHDLSDEMRHESFIAELVDNQALQQSRSIESS